MRAVLTRETPVGLMTLVEENGALTEAIFGGSNEPQTQTPLLAQAFEQLDEYFAGKRQTFDLPLKPVGTPFQLACWQALQTIPYGQTVSYGEQAARVGKPKACRAVGMANHRNPISIIIPCHRVVGKNGSLTGYGGGLAAKEYLLKLERDRKDGR